MNLEEIDQKLEYAKDQKKAAASFAELEAYRKKVSKKLSRSALSELKELSPKQVLNLQFLL